MDTLGQERRLFSNRALFALIAPLVVEQLLSILAGLVDSIMVAAVGEAAVSGVSLIDNIMVLLIYIFSALATGGAVVAGQYLGQKDEAQAKRAANELIWFSGLLSLAVTLVLYLGRGFILNVLFGRIEPDVYSQADIYLTITSASVPFIALYSAGAAVFRTMGNSRLTMYVSLLANGINIAGNAICIYGLHMGAEGVAIPTLLSRVVAAGVILCLLARPKHVLGLERRMPRRFDGGMVRRILTIGIPNGLENGMFQLGKILLLSMVSGFGTVAITANAVTNVLASFQALPGQAVGLAETTVISRCVGAGDYEQVRHYFKKLLLVTYAVNLTGSVLVLLTVNPVLNLYHLSPETEALTRHLLWIHTFGAVTLWALSFNQPVMFRAAGDVRFTMVISVASMWVFRLLVGWVLATVLQLGVTGVWLAMMVDWLFRSVVFFLRYRSGKWQAFRVV